MVVATKASVEAYEAAIRLKEAGHKPVTNMQKLLAIMKAAVDEKPGESE